MSLKQNDIQTLTNAIMAEAQQEAKQILANAQAKADDIQERTEKKAKAEKASHLQLATEEAEALHKHAIAAAKLEAQTLKLQRREELLNRVFEHTQEKLSEIPASNDYTQTVRYLINEAIRLLNIDKEAVVRADTRTQAVLSESFTAAMEHEIGVRLIPGAPLPYGTGIVVETPDHHRRYDNTLEARLERMKAALRTPVYHLLIGETL